MPKRGDKKAKAPLPNADDPDSMALWVWRFLQWLQTKNYSDRTIKNRLSYLGFFVIWADARGLVYPHEVTRPALRRTSGTACGWPTADRCRSEASDAASSP